MMPHCVFRRLPLRNRDGRFRARNPTAFPAPAHRDDRPDRDRGLAGGDSLPGVAQHAVRPRRAGHGVPARPRRPRDHGIDRRGIALGQRRAHAPRPLRGTPSPQTRIRDASAREALAGEVLTAEDLAREDGRIAVVPVLAPPNTSRAALDKWTRIGRVLHAVACPTRRSNGVNVPLRRIRCGTGCETTLPPGRCRDGVSAPARSARAQRFSSGCHSPNWV